MALAISRPALATNDQTKTRMFARCRLHALVRQLLAIFRKVYLAEDSANEVAQKNLDEGH